MKFCDLSNVYISITVKAENSDDTLCNTSPKHLSYVYHERRYYRRVGVCFFDIWEIFTVVNQQSVIQTLSSQ